MIDRIRRLFEPFFDRPGRDPDKQKRSRQGKMLSFRSIGGFHNAVVTDRCHSLMDMYSVDQGGGFDCEQSFTNEFHLFPSCSIDRNSKLMAPHGVRFHDGCKVCEIIDAITESSETSNRITIPT